MKTIGFARLVGLVFIFSVLLNPSSVWAQNSIAYCFDGNFEANNNSPALSVKMSDFAIDEDACTDNISFFDFNQNPGLRLDASATPGFLGDAYTVEMLFSLDDVGGWVKLLDFEGRTSDNGLYDNIPEGVLELFEYDVLGTTLMESNVIYHLIFRRAADNTITVWLNGNLEFSADDAEEFSILDDNESLYFFTDDFTTVGEAAPGGAYMLRLHKDDLTETQVDDLFNLSFCQLVEGARPSSITETPLTYLFNGDFTEENGIGPDLEIDNVFLSDNSTCIESFQYFNFNGNPNLTFDNTAAGDFLGEAYTIQMIFSLDDVSDYARLLDFINLEEDQGLYVSSDDPGVLTFFDYDDAVGETPLETSRIYHLVFRREADQTMTAWLDGNLEFEFPDTDNFAVLSEENLLRFFTDDGSEASPGKAYYIRLFDEDLTDGEVDDLFLEDFCDLVCQDEAEPIAEDLPNMPANRLFLLVLIILGGSLIFIRRRF